jgi:hypothetical protein
MRHLGQSFHGRHDFRLILGVIRRMCGIDFAPEKKEKRPLTRISHTQYDSGRVQLLSVQAPSNKEWFGGVF